MLDNCSSGMLYWNSYCLVWEVSSDMLAGGGCAKRVLRWGYKYAQKQENKYDLQYFGVLLVAAVVIAIRKVNSAEFFLLRSIKTHPLGSQQAPSDTHHVS